MDDAGHHHHSGGVLFVRLAAGGTVIGTSCSSGGCGASPVCLAFLGVLARHDVAVVDVGSRQLAQYRQRLSTRRVGKTKHNYKY